MFLRLVKQNVIIKKIKTNNHICFYIEKNNNKYYNLYIILDLVMKKILKGLCILLFIFILSACTKDYKPITYTKFMETFKSEPEYLINNKTPLVDEKFERFIIAAGKNNQFTFYELKTEEAARNYVELNYKGQKGYSYKDKKDYIVVKNSKGGYFYLIQIDNVIVIGNTEIKANKKEVNRIFKELGF